MSMIWFDGEYIDDRAVYTLHDRIRLGDGLFDTMLVYAGKLVQPQMHFEKTINHAKWFFQGWQAPSIDALIDVAHGLMKRNTIEPNQRYAINTSFSRGASGQGLMIPDNYSVQIAMRITPCPAEFGDVHAIVANSVRRNEGSPLSQFKNCNYGDNILAVMEATERGATDAIMLNNKDHVACSTTSNIFIKDRNGLYVTPPLSDGVQQGVTRKRLMQALEIEERSLKAEDLYEAHGVWLGNSIRGIVPLITLDKQEIAQSSLPIDPDFHLK